MAQFANLPKTPSGSLTPDAAFKYNSPISSCLPAFLFNKFSKYLIVARTQIRLLILGISVKHENLVLADQVVNDPYATALAAPTSHPSNLTQAFRLWNKVTSFWIGDEYGLEGRVGLIVDKIHNFSCENVSLIENHWLTGTIRQ